MTCWRVAPGWAAGPWCAGLAAALVTCAVGVGVAADEDQSAGPEAPVRRVDVALDVDGQLHGPATGAAEPVRQPIAMRARFEFFETLQPATAAAAAVRHYVQAEASLDGDGGTRSLTLPADARQVSVARLGTTPLPYLPTAYLSRDELELLETPFDSLLLEEMVPGRPVAAGDRWPLGADLAAGLLAIDTLEAGTLEARLVECADGVARVALEGVVDGAVDGVPTHVVVDGEFTVAAEDDEDGHVLVGDVTRLEVVVKEHRQAGHVAAGFEIEARLILTRAPAGAASLYSASEVGAEDAPAASARRHGPGKPGAVWYRDPEGRYDLVHEAGWRCVEENAGGLVLRLVDLGALVAQCSITALPRSEATAVPEVEEVKRHVEQSLAGQFQRCDGVEERVRDEDGTRIVRVASAGSASGLPFRWVHYVLTDDAGHRVHVTFMCEASLEKRFADADARLVAGLRLVGGAPREARLPRKTEVP